MTRQALSSTEYTIRTTAKGLAEKFYEQKRSGKFRSMDALTRAKALQKQPNGEIHEVNVIVPFRQAYPNAHAYSVAHWPFFYEAARKCLVTMLALPDSRVSAHMKEAIHKALVEDRTKQLVFGGRHLVQVGLDKIGGP